MPETQPHMQFFHLRRIGALRLNDADRHSTWIFGDARRQRRAGKGQKVSFSSDFVCMTWSSMYRQKQNGRQPTGRADVLTLIIHPGGIIY